MVLKNKKLLVSVLFLSVLLALSFGVEVPELRSPINDYAKVLDADTEYELNDYLTRLEDETGIQLAILTVPTIEDETIESFSMRVAEDWKLGQEGKDNGILITLALAEHKIRIEVGYGLEGVLTDTQSGLILRNAIIPHFKDGNYNRGLHDGVSNIVGLILNDDELLDEDVLDENSGRGFVVLIFIGIWVIFILLIVFTKSSRRGSGNGAVTAAILFDTLTDIASSSSSHSGSFGGFSGGGGGFGGGGASGGW